MGRENYSDKKRLERKQVITIAFTGVIVLSVFLLISFFYKRKEIENIDKNKHKLWFAYGMAMMIADILPKKIVRNSRISSVMKMLVVRDNIEKEKYLYIVVKITTCILALWITFVLALGVGISEGLEEKRVSTVSRSESVDKEYKLQIVNEAGQKEQVTINVEKKQYTKEQIEKIFEKRKGELIKKVLGKNKSLDKVNQNLNLVSQIGKEKISVTWDISDRNILDYEGALSDNISKEGELVTLTATMMFQKTTFDYIFVVNVFPKKQKNSKEEELQAYVNENAKYEKEVKLPEIIGGEKVKYENIVSEISGYVLIIGIITSIVLFFLKDTDLKKEADKRNQQLLNDYPEIVSKIFLYNGAGLSIKSTIERIVSDYEEEKRNNKKTYRYAYEELSMCLIRMKSGVSEIVAINRFGQRCKLHCYVKLAGIIEQNIQRGTKDLSLVLKNELREAMAEKKNSMLKRGGQISTKLLGPMIMMLIISMVIIMVPAFMSMEF